MNIKGRILELRNGAFLAAGIVFYCAALADAAFGQAAAGPAKLTLEQAIDLAIQRNHSLLATRTTIQQNLAQEVTANLRPNPTFFTDWEYLPLYKPNEGILDYLHDSTEGDIGMSYMFERGEKRQHRLEAAQDATAVTRSQVSDSERTSGFSGWPALHQCPAGGVDAGSRAAGFKELSRDSQHQRQAISNRHHRRERFFEDEAAVGSISDGC